ncbi:hypothetical protein C2E31_00675 [Rhodopirellula baltica]|nr:hypothetical protein C2E31_00675 [Rhodopirellula baltica]
MDGKEFTVLTAERTLIPDRPGEFELDPISATIRVVTQWQRQRSGLDDFGFGGSLLEEAFGGRSRPMEVKLYRAEGKPHRFQVKPFPSADRPESFAGAVGSGFTLDVAADRTVVRAGDPIRLTIDIRGDGNLENATLPSLFADGGLSKDQFRVPEGDVPGVFDPDTLTKTFEVLVRVEDENIDELPALRYSWFDPNNETYQTTLSSPIALRVNPASMVTADAVVSSGARKRTDGNTTDQTMETVDLGRASSDGISPSQVLSGVDLSLTTDANRLLAAPSGLLASGAFQGSVYVIAALCLIWMMVGKQRKQSDPAERQAKTLATQLGQQIQSAASMNAKTGAAQIAEALRSALRELDAVDREAIQVTIAKCEAIEFRPDPASQSTLDPALIDEAARHLP